MGNPTQAGRAPQMPPGHTLVAEQLAHAKAFNEREMADPRGTNFPSEVQAKAGNLAADNATGVVTPPLQVQEANTSSLGGLKGATPGQRTAAAFVTGGIRPPVHDDAVRGMQHLLNARHEPSKEPQDQIESLSIA